MPAADERDADEAVDGDKACAKSREICPGSWTSEPAGPHARLLSCSRRGRGFGVHARGPAPSLLAALCPSCTDASGSAPVWTPRPAPPSTFPPAVRGGNGLELRVRTSPHLSSFFIWTLEVPLLLPAPTMLAFWACSVARPLGGGSLRLRARHGAPAHAVLQPGWGLPLLGLDSHHVPAHEVTVRHPLARAPPTQRSGNGQNERDGGKG